MNDVTQLLSQIEGGDPSAAHKLLPIVYDELRKLAAARLKQEKPGQTLQSTALVHEAYMRLVDSDVSQQWNGRGHFFKSAAEAMRRILVEKARRKRRVRHGGEIQRVPLADQASRRNPDAATILAVDEALSELAYEDPAAAEVVNLHFFSGFTLDETAAVLDVSRATVYRHWAYARARLRIALSGENSEKV